ncbi:MAG TPA: hopanoid-associated sugar epimerase, partial [Blastocatellia bacterium]
MKAFITGATGFVGANVVRALLADGFQVRALVRPGANSANIDDLDTERVSGSLADRATLRSAMRGCEAVFHVAAFYSLWKADGKALYRANVDGSRNIFQAAEEAGVNRIVYTSSVAALGVPPPGQIGDESLQTSEAQLVSDYKKSKYLAEQEALARARRGQHIVIVNPSTPIGAFDIKPTPTGEIVLRFLNKGMPAYVDTGLNIVDVEDVARAHILALERGRPGERYILGNRNLTLKELLDILSGLTGIKAPTVQIPHIFPLMVALVDEGVLSRLGKKPSVSINSVAMSSKAMYYDSAKAVRELGMRQSPIEGALEKAVR